VLVGWVPGGAGWSWHRGPALRGVVGIIGASVNRLRGTVFHGKLHRFGPAWSLRLCSQAHTDMPRVKPCSSSRQRYGGDTYHR